MSTPIQQEPVVKSGRARQKPLEPEPSPGPGTATYRCIRQRQYKGRIYYVSQTKDETYVLPSPLPKGFEEFFEKV